MLVLYLNFLYLCNIENEMDFESLTRKKYFSRALGKFLSCGGKNETRIDDNQFIKLILKIYYKIMALKVKAIEKLQKIGKYEGTYCYVMAPELSPSHFTP